METRASHSEQHQEAKSFDVLASVDLYKYDLQAFGHIHPETRQRVYDEELVYIAEGINRPLATEFELRTIDGKLVYFHNGQWQPYIKSLVNAVSVYRREARVDPRTNFMADRASQDLEIGQQIEDLNPGEKIRWYSSFPDRALELHGQKLVEDLGFQTARRMGFLNEAECQLDGTKTIRCQTVDNSDDEAYAAAIQADGDIEDMLMAYDQTMSRKHSSKFFAGRPANNQIPEENAWVIVEKHRDLLENYFFSKIEDLATQSIEQNVSRSDLERAKKRLTYGVWAALKVRLDQNIPPFNHGSQNYENYGDRIQQEVDSAYAALSAKGEVLFGCGGAIRGEAALLSASAKDVFEAIFGSTMTCPFCKDKNQHGDPCSNNQFCTNCEAEVKDGVVVSKGNGGKKANQEDILFGWVGRELAKYEAERLQKLEDEKRLAESA